METGMVVCCLFEAVALPYLAYRFKKYCQRKTEARADWYDLRSFIFDEQMIRSAQIEELQELPQLCRLADDRLDEICGPILGESLETTLRQILRAAARQVPET